MSYRRSIYQRQPPEVANLHKRLGCTRPRDSTPPVTHSMTQTSTTSEIRFRESSRRNHRVRYKFTHMAFLERLKPLSFNPFRESWAVLADPGPHSKNVTVTIWSSSAGPTLARRQAMQRCRRRAGHPRSLDTHPSPPRRETTSRQETASARPSRDPNHLQQSAATHPPPTTFHRTSEHFKEPRLVPVVGR